MTSFHPMKSPSSFRKIAAGMWRGPNNPTIYGIMDLDATPALRHLEEQRHKTGAKVTMTHLVAQAVALSLRKYPEINAKIHWGRIVLRGTADVFLQVTSEGGRDLSGVKVSQADTKTLAELAGELAAKSSQIREGRDPALQKSRGLFRSLPGFLVGPLLRLSSFLVNTLHIDLKGQGMPLDPFGGAMVTSVGMFGIDTALAPFVPISRCPIIVLVNSVTDRPWVDGGQVVVRPVLRLTGTFDHRVIDGYNGALFSNSVRELLARPEEMDAMARQAAPAALPAAS
jgi:pyruvate/2-oxoglutarate dehydrogenase complex dihydrolipoamide acyltransferase (E2) component